MEHPHGDLEERIAYHESGHAVIAVSLDCIIDWVGTIPIDQAVRFVPDEGAVIHPGIAAGCVFTKGDTFSRLDDVTVSLGGIAAEAIKYANGIPETHESDWEYVRQRLKRSKMAIRDQVLYHRKAFARATDILKEDWERVERLAEALFEHKELTGHDVLLVMYPELNTTERRIQRSSWDAWLERELAGENRITLPQQPTMIRLESDVRINLKSDE